MAAADRAARRSSSSRISAPGPTRTRPSGPVPARVARPARRAPVPDAASHPPAHRVVGIDHQRRVAHDLGAGRGVGRDDRAAAGHGLDQRDAEALVVRWEQQPARQAVDGGHVFVLDEPRNHDRLARQVEALPQDPASGDRGPLPPGSPGAGRPVPPPGHARRPSASPRHSSGGRAPRPRIRSGVAFTTMRKKGSSGAGTGCERGRAGRIGHRGELLVGRGMDGRHLVGRDTRQRLELPRRDCRSW